MRNGSTRGRAVGACEARQQQRSIRKSWQGGSLWCGAFPSAWRMRPEGWREVSGLPSNGYCGHGRSFCNVLVAAVPFLPQRCDTLAIVAQVNMAATMESVLQDFDGDFAVLPSFSLAEGFLSCPYYQCPDNLKLFAASIPTSVVGAHRWRKRVDKESLWFVLLAEGDLLAGGGREAAVPARFFWLTRRKVLRRARLYFGSDTMHSVMLSSYTRTGRKPLAVHRLLGWSLKCPVALAEQRWGRDFDVHHQNNNHNDNSLPNLFCWKASGPQGHRAYSAWFAAQERARRRALEDAEGEEEEEQENEEESEEES